MPWTLKRARRAPLVASVFVSSGSAYSPEVSQYFDRLLTPPVGASATRYATYIDTLVSGGVWAKLDDLQLWGATPDNGTSLINLKSASFQATLNTATGTPTFTANSGWKGCAALADNSVNLNFNPSTAGGNFTQNDAMICGWSIGTTVESKPLITGVSGSGNLEIWTFGATTYFSVNTNGTETGTATPTPRDGFWLAQRTASNAQAFYHNDTAFASSATASAALVNETLVFAQTANIGAMIAIGASLTTGQQTTLYNATQTILQGSGAI